MKHINMLFNIRKDDPCICSIQDRKFSECCGPNLIVKVIAPASTQKSPLLITSSPMKLSTFSSAHITLASSLKILIFVYVGLKPT